MPEDFTAFIEDLDEGRVSPADPSQFLLTPKARRFAREQARKSRRLAVAAAQLDVDLPEERGRFNRFMDLLQNLDRPRNAAHNAILGAMRGDTDGLLQNLKQGWTFEERAHFEDILDELGVEVGLVRKIAGFGGDVILDPLNLVPFSLIAKPIQATRVGSLINKAIVKAGQNSALRQTVVRWSGIPGMDKIFNEVLDMKGWVQHAELMEKARPIMLGLRQLQKASGFKGDEGSGILSRLAEETDINRVSGFLSRVRQGNLKGASLDELDELVTTSREFRNPTVVKDLLRVGNPELQDAWVQLGRQFQGFNQNIARIRESRGLVVPKLGDNLQKIVTELDTEMRRIVLTRRAAITRSQKATLKATTQAMKTARSSLREAGVSPSEIRAGLKEAQVKLAEATVGEPFETVEEAMGALDQMVGDMNPDLLARLKDAVLSDFAKNNKAIRYYDQVTMRNLVDSINRGSTGRKLQRALLDQQRIEAAITELPRWVHHLVTPEAEGLLLDAFRRRRSFRNFFAQPKTADILHRAFVKKMKLNSLGGREAEIPLSFDEIEASLRAEGLPGKFAKKGRKLEGAEVSEALTRKQLLRRDAPKIARFFDVSEAQVLASGIQSTAKAVTAAEYLTQTARIFGHRRGDVGSPEEWNKLTPLTEIPGLSAMRQMMPQIGRGLDEVGFDPLVADEIARRWDVLVNPSPVLKIFDGLQNYWKSYTLFLYPWYHSRNAIGDYLNMWQGGWKSLSNPGAAIRQTIQAGRLQAASMMHNTAAVRSSRFFFKSIGEEIRGDELIDLAMQNGVLNSGWMGGHLTDDIQGMIEPMMLGVRSALPIGNQFVPLRIGKWAGEYLENQRRLTFFMHHLEQGGDVRVAAAEVKKYLGDYRSEIMTPVERDFGSRIFPFMRWNRFNIPLQVMNLFHAGPRAKMMAILRGSEAVAPEGFEPSDLPEYVPEWIRESAGVPVQRDPETGELRFWLLKNWHPASELDNVLTFHAFGKLAVNQLSPLIKTPIETAAGISLFRGQELPDEVEFLGTQMSGRTANFLRNLRFLNEADKFDPLGMFRVLRTRRTEPGVLGFLRESALLTATGGRPLGINPAREQLELDVERNEIMSRRVARAKRILAKEEFGDL